MLPGKLEIYRIWASGTEVRRIKDKWWALLLGLLNLSGNPISGAGWTRQLVRTWRPPAGIEREPHSHTYRHDYPGFTSSTCILAALPSLTKSPPLTVRTLIHPPTRITALYKKFYRWRCNWHVGRWRRTSSSRCLEGIWCLHLQGQEEWP